MNFKDSLNDLLIEKDINIKELSKETKIDDSVLYEYLNGSLPNIEHSVILANYFNCSLNFLMGLDQQPNIYKFKSTYDISSFSKRYDNILKENNISHFKVCKLTKLNYSSHYAWQRGSVPAMSSLIIIAKFFNVSIDYLIGRV